MTIKIKIPRNIFGRVLEALHLVKPVWIQIDLNGLSISISTSHHKILAQTIITDNTSFQMTFNEMYNQYKNQFTVPNQNSIEYLEASLKQAEADQRFEDAAKIRDHINNLSKK